MALKFKVESKSANGLTTKCVVTDNGVVRPATSEEVDMWDRLVELEKFREDFLKLMPVKALKEAVALLEKGVETLGKSKPPILVSSKPANPVVTAAEAKPVDKVVVSNSGLKERLMEKHRARLGSGTSHTSISSAVAAAAASAPSLKSALSGPAGKLP